MKKWTIKWHKDAVEDLEGIDHSVRQYYRNNRKT